MMILQVETLLMQVRLRFFENLFNQNSHRIHPTLMSRTVLSQMPKKWK
jgi:hypothetical protein